MRHTAPVLSSLLESFHLLPNLHPKMLNLWLKLLSGGVPLSLEPQMFDYSLTVIHFLGCCDFFHMGGNDQNIKIGNPSCFILT